MLISGSKTSIRSYPKNSALFRCALRRPPLSHIDRPISIFVAGRVTGYRTKRELDKPISILEKSLLYEISQLAMGTKF